MFVFVPFLYFVNVFCDVKCKISYFSKIQKSMNSSINGLLGRYVALYSVISTVSPFLAQVRSRLNVSSATMWHPISTK